MKYEVIEAKPFHCGQILRRLRHEHVQAIARVGAGAHRELRALFEESYIRRGWLIDGRLEALGGVSGSLASHYGFVWVALSQEATRHKFALVREAKRQLDNIMITKSELVTTIVGGDHAAKRLAIFLGFHCEHGGPGSPAYSKFARRTLSEHLEANPDVRIPIGNGYIVCLGYHQEAA
jgi:hypothetical protein